MLTKVPKLLTAMTSTLQALTATLGFDRLKWRPDRWGKTV